MSDPIDIKSSISHSPPEDESPDNTTSYSSMQAPLSPSLLRVLREVLNDNSGALEESLSYHNRFDHLSRICDAFVHLYNEANNIQEAHIKSAIELDDKAIQAFQKKIKEITGDDAKISTSVDEDLLGGFVLNINNLQYDASILNKLNTLKREFTLN